MVLDEPKDSDEVFKINGFTMVMDKELHSMTKDVTVDYVNYGIGSGFKVSCEVPIAGEGNSCGSCRC